MRRTNLKVNEAKTEYMVYGSESHHRFFNTEGRLIRSSNKINYLGFQRTTKDGLNHIQNRIQKARIAGLTTNAILLKVPDLPILAKLRIVNACTRSTFLHGTEACSEEDMEKVKSEMNKILRRLGRTLLRSSNAAANQTIQLDLGWPTMKAELQLRKVNLALKTLSSNKEGKIIKSILREAIRVGTPWTDEVNDLIGDTTERGVHLGRYSARDELSFAKSWLMKDRRNQLRRLEQRVITTTGLYRDLTSQPAVIEPAPYITTNPRRNDDI